MYFIVLFLCQASIASLTGVLDGAVWASVITAARAMSSPEAVSGAIVQQEVMRSHTAP